MLYELPAKTPSVAGSISDKEDDSTESLTDVTGDVEKTVRQLLDEGHPAEIIGIKVGISLDVIESISKNYIKYKNPSQLNESRTPRSILESHLETLTELITLIDRDSSCDLEYDKKANAISTLVRTSQDVLKHLQQFDAKSETVRQIDKLILRPLFQELIKTVTLEINKIRQESVKIDSKAMPEVDKGLACMLTSLSGNLRLIYYDNLTSLCDYNNLSQEEKDKILPVYRN